MVLNFRKFIALCFAFLFIGCTDFQRDNPDDLKGINYKPDNADISSSSRSSSSFAPSSSSLIRSSSSSVPVSDGRGNNISSYRTVRIGEQVWMAENLDYAVEGSKCYDNNPANCNTYGQLYDWATAMALPSNCNSNSCSGQINSPHRGICPSGWHIPSNDDWATITRAPSGSAATSRTC